MESLKAPRLRVRTRRNSRGSVGNTRFAEEVRAGSLHRTATLTATLSRPLNSVGLCLVTCQGNRNGLQ